MSGGSMDYLCFKVEEVAEQLTDKENTPLQRAFGEHLKKVADALHDIEWVWSGDYGAGRDEEAIKKVINDDQVKEVLYKDAIELCRQLSKFLPKPNPEFEKGGVECGGGGEVKLPKSKI